MFGFSFFKIAVLAIIVAGVLFGYKWVNRITSHRERTKKTRSQYGEGAKHSREEQIDAEEMIRCIVCGSYSASSSLNNCGKETCPYS